MNIDKVINGWTFEETIKTAESFMEVEKNMFKWDVIRHLRDFLELYREQLKEYQQLEEQGRLIKLPCKVGDTVYVVTSPFNVFDDIEYEENMKDEVYESYVSSITFYECGEQYRIYAKATNHFIGAYFRECDFGKTVFLTKSEAEQKLKEMESD